MVLTISLEGRGSLESPTFLFFFFSYILEETLPQKGFLWVLLGLVLSALSLHLLDDLVNPASSDVADSQPSP